MNLSLISRFNAWFARPFVLKKKNLGCWFVICSLFPPLWGMVDENANGVSDVWEALYGELTNPTEDSDGDGYTNLEEAQAGTHPHDADSSPQITSIEQRADDEVVSRIRTAAGVRYQLYASPDLKSWYPMGPGVRGSGGEQEVYFDLADSQSTGTALLSKWSNLEGVTISGVRGYAGSSSPAPDIEREVSSLSLSQSNPNEDNYGMWIRGWIVAQETGEHRFWLSGDDQSELWLSANAEPDELTQVVTVSGWTGFQEWDKYPEQASDPISLVAGEYYYYELFHKEWTGGDHLSLAWELPSNTTGIPTVIEGAALSTLGVSLGGLMGEGGRVFFRFDAVQDDTDGDGLTDYEEGVLGFDPTYSNTQPRRPDFEEALARLSSGNTLSLGVSRSRAYESTGAPAEWVIFRNGSVEPLTVHLQYTGSATSGSDYVALPTTVEFPAGASAVFLPVQALADGVLEGQESITAEILASADYVLGAPVAATVLIDDAPDEIYQSYLRPREGATGGQGLVVLRKTGNDLAAWLDLSFSGLSSAHTGTAFYVSEDGGVSGDAFLSYASGRLTQQEWDLQPETALSQADMLVALSEGRVWVRVLSEWHPEGELFGQLGEGVDLPVSAPASLPAPEFPSGSDEVSRFLMQASFGPRPIDLELWGTQSFEEWIDDQQSLPATYHLPYVQDRIAEWMALNGSDGWQSTRQEAFWQHAITAEDQLRQRMAFALSEILVVSQNGALAGYHESVTTYYDLLLRHAFGNYRDLLEEVTLSPMMGTYLSMNRNQKPDRETGYEPDENYAREIMQLFSIGLVQLHPDGSVKVDEEGSPLPTYSQSDIVGLAHIFTGWGPYYDDAHPPTWSSGAVASRSNWFRYGSDYEHPMTFYDEFHDHEDRTIVGDVTIPGELSGEARMAMALDTLFMHPNMGPFLAKQLIQRFVTSNPSPAYVARVSAVFDNNGSGERGDLGAVIKAILLDPEARHPDYREGYARGKAVEPVLRASRLCRAVDLVPARSGEGDGRFFVNFQYDLPEQAPLLAPSVFNFFQPGYVHPGEIDAAGVLSPEFQIFSETTAIRQANFMYGKIFWKFWTAEKDGEGNTLYTEIDWTRWIDVLQTEGLTPEQAQALLLDQLDTLLLGGSMSDALRAEIEFLYASLPSWFGFEDYRQEDRVQVAWYLILTSPEAFVLR
ncbi:DUF1800 family protein [Kiritimatiellota bacterium B12222]|nr:DUF1800 family protein [Kiritimatiellota bacterium B12222]